MTLNISSNNQQNAELALTLLTVTSSIYFDSNQTLFPCPTRWDRKVRYYTNSQCNYLRVLGFYLKDTTLNFVLLYWNTDSPVTGTFIVALFFCVVYQ